MNYTAAYQKALENFRASAFEEMAVSSGYTVQGHLFQIDFLGQQFTVEYPSGNFYPEPAPDGELPIFAQILILHYLTNIARNPLEDKLISYKELPGGNIYIQPFTNRAIRPMVKSFGNNPGRLLEAASRIGAEPVAHGDAAVKISVFPRIPVTLILWGGDDEFPASGNILFDASAPAFLHTEDYAVLASFVVGTLKKLASK